MADKEGEFGKEPMIQILIGLKLYFGKPNRAVTGLGEQYAINARSGLLQFDGAKFILRSFLGCGFWGQPPPVATE